MATLTVNINGGADYLHIQDAINAAAAGDTILVAAGIYDEIVTINKSLIILGAQANVNPQIGGRPGGESIIQYSTSGSGNRPVQIAASDIVFNGFEIADFFYGIQIPSSSFMSPVENISLEYNYIHSAVCFVGIVSEGGTLRNFKVSHNIVHVASAVNAIAAINLYDCDITCVSSPAFGGGRDTNHFTFSWLLSMSTLTTTFPHFIFLLSNATLAEILRHETSPAHTSSNASKY